MTGLIVNYYDVMYTAKESWILAKHVYLFVLCLRIDSFQYELHVYLAHIGSEQVITITGLSLASWKLFR